LVPKKNPVKNSQIILLAFLLLTVPSYAQQLMDAESICLPSPNVVSHFATKNYANNLVTGRADVNVPVYHLKDGMVDIPITLDYNTSGVKVNDHPGWVGSNWNLNAGGMITRVVKGKADEKKLLINVGNSDDFGPSANVDASAWLGAGTAIGILENGLNSTSIGGVETYVNNNEKTAFWPEKGIQDNIIFNILPTTEDNSLELECLDRNAVNNIPWKVLTMDGEPDEFMFKFMGHEGKLYFDPATNIWRVKGDPAIRVEITKGTINEKTISIDYNNIDFTTLKNILIANDVDDTAATLIINTLSGLYTNSATYDACETFDIQLKHQIISGFKMTMPDGTIYRFEDYEINREILRTPNLDFRADTWHLSEVIYPNGESANFCYTESPTHSFTFSKSQLSTSADIIENVYGRSSNTKYLSKIETEHFVTLFDISESEEMVYNYEKIFEVYRNHLNDIGEFSGLDNTYANFHDIKYSVESSIDNLSISIPYEAKILYNDVIPLIETLSEQASWYKLESIRVFSKNNCSAAYGSCCSSPRCDLGDCVPIKNKVFTYDNQTDERLRLKSVQEKDFLGYYFAYDNTSLPDYHSDLINTDHWGYYNGNTLLNISNIANQKTPNIGYTTAGILETVTLPTGGTINLEYQANTTAAVVKRNLITGQFNRFSESRVAGGLRVLRKTENPVFLSNSTFLDPIITTFSYSGGVINFEPLYDFESVHPIFHPSLNLMDNSVDGDTNTDGYSSIDLLQVIDYLPFCEIYNAEVQYENVWENQSGNGWTNYTFSTSMKNVYMNDNFTTYEGDNDNTLNIPQTAAYRSDEHRRGLIESVKFLKEGTGNVISETQFDYGFFSLLGQSSSIHSCQIMNRGVFDFADPILGKSSIHVGPYNLSETRHFEYDNFGNNPVTTITTYDYENTYNQLRETTSFRDFNENFNLDPLNTGGALSEHDTRTVTSYLYPFDLATSNDDMIAQNIINLPVVMSVTEADQIIDQKRTDYTTIGGNLHPLKDEIIVPKVFWNLSGEIFEIDYSVNTWDDYGNITSYKKALPGTNIDNTSNVNLFDLTTYAFSYSNNLLVNEAIESADGSNLYKSKTYQYDLNTRMLKSETDENGITTTYTYDDLERLITKTEDNDRKRTTYEYDEYLNDEGNPSNQTNKIRTREEFDYDLNNYWSTSFITDTHFDGLGRFNENERIGYAPDNSTITTNSVNYDEFGRVENKYLHGKDEFTNRFDNSPLNRKLRSESFIGDQDYEFLGHNIGNIETTDNANTIQQIYPEGSLSRYRSIDVNGNTTFIFKDFAGRTIRTDKSVDGNTDNVITCFIYDDLGRIQNVYAPNGAIYSYLYNQRGLLYQKGIPGQTNAQNNYYYDEKDRLVLHIDPENNQNITVYDAFDRVIEEGLNIPFSFNGNDDFNSININRVAFEDYYFGINNTAAQLIPDNKTNVYTYESIFVTPIIFVARDWIVQHSEYDINSLPTTTLINNNFTYDDIGRMTSTVSGNQFGNLTTDNFTYNHLGLLSKHYIDHNRPLNGTSDFNFVWTYIYDIEHRLLETRLNDGINSDKLISKLSYDNYDRVSERILGEEKYQHHRHYLQNINYKYDPFSRLREINKRCLEEEDVPTRESSSDTIPKVSTISIQLGKFEILRLSDLEYTAEENVLSLKKELNFPYTLIPETDNGFSKDLQKWLISNNYIIEKVDYKVDYTGNTTLILKNTNFDLEKIQLYDSNKKRVFVIGKNSKNYRKIVGQYCPYNPDPVYYRNEDLFYEKITYDASGSNIANIEWGTSCDDFDNDIIHRYDFDYDELDRMLIADYSAFDMDNQEITSSNFNYDVSVGYDLVGNITNLTRNGMLANGAFGLIDDLTYFYDEDQRLDNVNESSFALNTIGFQTIDPDGDDTYDYSNNGNIRENADKGLDFLYNHQNKLVSVDKGAGNNQNISYFGGNRLYRKVTQENGVSKQRDYIGNVEYVDGKLEAVYHTDGRLLAEYEDPNNPNKRTGWTYEYFIKDHLGNTRVVYKHIYDENNPDYLTNGFGEITYLEGSYGDGVDVSQVNHYYPFGMKMGGLWNFADTPTDAENQYQYNGKELNTDLNLNWYDYGARMYDPAVGRFMGVDPLAEKYNSWSPYTYTLNNPVKYIDPDGRDVISVNDKGLVQSIEPAEGKHRFFDARGNELFFHDVEGADDYLLQTKFSKGDRVYWPVNSKDFFEGILYKSALSPSISSKLYGNSSPLANYFIKLNYTATHSYSWADFAERYLVNKYDISNYGISNRGQNYLDDAGYFRFGNDNSIYNLYDAGNFMWGAWMKLNRYSYTETKVGSQLNEFFKDSDADQNAIRAGYHLKKSIFNK